MYYDLRIPVQSCIAQFDVIPLIRKTTLSELADYIRPKFKMREAIQLNYICTHNSRRSHFGQVAGALAAHYYSIDQVYTYSGGIEATAVNHQVIEVFKLFGMIVNPLDQNINTRYQIRIGHEDEIVCFSKKFDHPINPHKKFVALMTCDDADQKCPLIAGAEKRFVLSYEDPKVSDGLDSVLSVYRSRFEQILTENLYAFSLV